MELGNFDFQLQAVQDMAFEVEAESYITAVKQALYYQEIYVAELEQAMIYRRKQLQAEEAVYQSKFVAYARYKLNCKASEIMKRFRTDAYEAVLRKADSDYELYAKYLYAMLAEGREITGSNCTILCREKDAHYFQKEKVNPSLNEAERGLIVKSFDGKVSVDMTMRRRIDLALRTMYPQFAGLLVADYSFIE